MISLVGQTDDIMSVHSSSYWPLVFNLANSIIGVAVLALPFCFKEVLKFILFETYSTHTDTTIRPSWILSGTTRWAGTRKLKPIWIYWSRR